jgi:hypothetical protein
LATGVVRNLNLRVKASLLVQSFTELLAIIARKKTVLSPFAIVGIAALRHRHDETLQECLTQKVKGSGTAGSVVNIGESVSALVAHVRELKVEMRSELVLNS